MAWKIKFSTAAERELDKLNPEIAKRILSFLNSRVSVLDNPRNIGQALKGSKLGEFWRYRVGDYRIVVSIEDLNLSILVVKIGNRKEVYRNS